MQPTNCNQGYQPAPPQNEHMFVEWNHNDLELLSNLANVKQLDLLQVAKNYFPDKNIDDVRIKFNRVRMEKQSIDENYKKLKKDKK